MIASCKFLKLLVFVLIFWKEKKIHSSQTPKQIVLFCIWLPVVSVMLSLVCCFCVCLHVFTNALFPPPSLSLCLRLSDGGSSHAAAPPPLHPHLSARGTWLSLWPLASNAGALWPSLRLRSCSLLIADKMSKTNTKNRLQFLKKCFSFFVFPLFYMHIVPFFFFLLLLFYFF